MLSWAVVSRQFVSRGESFAAAIALKVHLGPRALRAFAQASCSVSGKLPLSAKTFAALLTVVLLLGKVEAQVVLHGQPVGVRGVANVAVVLSNFMKVLVVGQAAGVAVRLSAFFTGKRSSPTFSRVKLLGPGGPSRRVRLLKALMAVLDPHDWAL